MNAAQTVELQVFVSGKNIDLTPALEAHARAKLRKIERFFANHPAVRIEVVLSVDKSGETAEVTVYAGRFVLRGESTTHDMYHSINEAVGRIEGQMRKLKTRAARRLYSEPAPWVGAGDDPTASGALAAWPEPIAIARRKRFVIKPMDPAEAAMQMELLGHDFFVFTDAETFEARVLYRRKDGAYGLIEPVIG